MKARSVSEVCAKCQLQLIPPAEGFALKVDSLIVAVSFYAHGWFDHILTPSSMCPFLGTTYNLSRYVKITL